MKRKFALLLAAMLMLCAASAAAMEHTTQITVRGTATLTAAPDMVTVMANASVNAPSVGEAQTQLSAITQDAGQRLEALGVKPEDIVTSSYSYYPTYNYDGDVPRITGYQASHTMEIVCRDPDMLDSVIAAITDSGVNEIYSVNYGISDRNGLYQEALGMAIAAAEGKAMHMASVSGVTLQGVVSITEDGSSSGSYVYTANADAKAVMGTGIRAGSVSVSAGVTVVYEAAK